MLKYLQDFITKVTIIIKLFNSIIIDEDSITLDNPVDCDVFINTLDKDFVIHTKRRIFINCSKDFRAQLREEQECFEEVYDLEEDIESIESTLI
jgi:hypothetical protein